MKPKPISPELAALLSPRIMRGVIKDDATGCWLRVKAVNPVTGYTHITRMIDGAKSYFYAHRVMYVYTHGPIPDGLTIDHLCKTPACCNPSHLEAVTHRVNVLRSDNAAALNARLTHCKKGHVLTVLSNGRRRCVLCRNERAKVSAKVRRQERAAQGMPEGEKHGTRRGYVYWSCRCPDCRNWHHEEYERYKAKRAAVGQAAA